MDSPARDLTARRDGRRKVLVLASTFPSSVQPIHGVFVKERVKAVAARDEFDLRVMSPIPYFPPLKFFPRWYPLSQVPRQEVIDGLAVSRPRYALIPKIGGYWHSELMYWGIRNAVKRLYAEFPFELIDAHFVYADGVVAAMLGRDYNVPVVMTARGEDMARFPQLPVIGQSIRWGLQHATRLIAVSEEFAGKMRDLGAASDKVSVISNGVDTTKFQMIPQDEARRAVGLPVNRPIILVVGYLLENKGFHLAVRALPAIRQRFPDAMLVIVGGVARWGLDYTKEIEAAIQETGMEESVRMVGPRPPEEVHLWYSSADVFAMLSQREGSPNAPMEALACGLPIVATPVGSIPQLLSKPGLGVMLSERSVAEAARGLTAALEMTWDRPAIREWAKGKSWTSVAEQVAIVFQQALASHAAARK
ncbi:MAG: glycosyltransferase [Planctomycetota bacterium]|nr:glycosyltransferase [Planctomycetota bacterium]